MKIEFALQGADGLLRTLQMFPKEVIGAGKTGPCAKAVRRGAIVIMRQAKRDFRKAVALPGKSGITDSSGFTESKIFVKRLQPKNGVRGERYIVSVIPKPHPSNKLIRRKSRSMGKRKKRGGPKPRLTGANDVAFIMEYGSKNQPATPWLRPAFMSKRDEAVTTIISSLSKDLAKIWRRLGLQGTSYA